ncbi:hypothetical protein ACM46_03515 [Chryseobacterium angstadtii]|uniref:Uncharacterized protein n=1 Tax=Chryseobacterium angstadtii TaxID=558151 RepID=A0A0J7IKP4_9FLAO|nr:hypothetical protein ACM46_03515 [Chryseobacterium angstadtii]
MMRFSILKFFFIDQVFIIFYIQYLDLQLQISGMKYNYTLLKSSNLFVEKFSICFSYRFGSHGQFILLKTVLHGF